MSRKARREQQRKKNELYWWNHNGRWPWEDGAAAPIMQFRVVENVPTMANSAQNNRTPLTFVFSESTMTRRFGGIQATTTTINGIDCTKTDPSNSNIGSTTLGQI